MKYYHYSAYGNSIDISKIEPVINIENSVRNKPKQTSGLWGSPVDSRNGWEKFCLENKIFIEMLRYRTTFELKPESKVLVIENYSDLSKLNDYLLPNNTEFNNIFIDWEKLAKNYDAFILKIKPITEIEIDDEYIEFWRYFCDWDVDSILVFNGNSICNCSEPEYLEKYSKMESSQNESFSEKKKKLLKDLLNIYY